LRCISCLPIFDHEKVKTGGWKKQTKKKTTTRVAKKSGGLPEKNSRARQVSRRTANCAPDEGRKREPYLAKTRPVATVDPTVNSCNYVSLGTTQDVRDKPG